MLALKVPMKSREEHHDTDAYECCADGLSETAHVQTPVVGGRGGGEGGVEAEELGYCYTD